MQAVSIKLRVPPHVQDTLATWAGSELDEQPEVVLEALADELCQNPELRTFAARLVAD